MSCPAPRLDDRIVQSGDVMMRKAGDEAVLLDIASEQYFGLDPIGTWIWQLIGELEHLDRVHARLCAVFDADAQRIATDLLALTQALLDAGLVRRVS